ncbi:hypothetical protein JAAARDRAFT_198713 [Jaapia argillacea MUCL 33604]|uniref:Phospholipid-transporting ATPase n=1 Tax=Jaapia argillacea MUCL 33604 TaxID=933084 RepID=A0A067PND7_9AGAM|nr:hypothetical protein JAAARDRAFT_198713 [Jaapia argillacea MUCL 33604]
MPFTQRRPSRRQPPDPDDGASTDEDMPTIDPELRLRTVRTAASTIAESIRSEQRAERRKSLRKKGSRFFRKVSGEKKRAAAEVQSVISEAGVVTPATGPTAKRRNVYVNMPLSPNEVDGKGEPVVRYVRNKVRTSKYTILTFIPKNLYEQFRRVANLYFLALVVVQVFPIFGAANPQIAMLPLVFILTVTAIKDGIEDYRRASLDEQVNTSAVTRLGGSFRNPNLPSDPRSMFEKLFGLNKPGRVTKGVRKLREREVSAGIEKLGSRRGMGEPEGTIGRSSGGSGFREGMESRNSLGFVGAGGRRLDDIQSIDSHSYPPSTMTNSMMMGVGMEASKATLVGSEGNLVGEMGTRDYYHQDPGFSSGQAHPSSSMDTTTTGGSGGPSNTAGAIGCLDLTKRTPGTARWERTLWKKLEVGDIVLLHENEQVPADLIVLSSSLPDGTCYLETKNLDGETNLKVRRAVKATMGIGGGGHEEEDVERVSFWVDSEGPRQDLYAYHGVLKYRNPGYSLHPPSTTSDPRANTDEFIQESISISSLLLRGCTLRNTPYIIGLVVFTGADTKIMMNGGDTPSKRSKIERETNFNVGMNFLVLVGMCIVTAIVSGWMAGEGGGSADYFEVGSGVGSVGLESVVTFVSCLIAFQNIVPISLYISIEIVKTIQAFFISQDIDMYYKPFDTACVPKTWNISDDLGQIEYIFSDKTGTLTQNVMEFQKCSVRGVAYGEGITEAMKGAAKRQGGGVEQEEEKDPEEVESGLRAMKEDMLGKMGRNFKNRYLRSDQLTLISPKLADDLADRSNEQRAHLIAFFRSLAICHSVLADRPEPNRFPFLVEYKAESPDEAALVGAARDVGFPFVNKSKDFIDIEVMGQAERYIPLKTLEFNSTRKRMSVIVRNPDGKIVLYCKGADSVIYARLDPGHDVGLKEATQRDMEAFANGGLRTLCVAYRVLEEDEYFRWERVYDNATAATKNREEEEEKACELVERDLTILGATALEDKLQEGVPEAIEILHRAGIKLWILTGDKVQTAIEIGFSCNLLKSDMEVMILSADTAESARAQIEAGLNKIASVLGPPSWDPKHRGFIQGTTKASFAVVIDGETLKYALEADLKPLFLNLGTQCETVVCCRVSPAQKALTVKLVKEGRNAMTLSIGDGANDVAMIQEANIGCGLFGLEGSQAAMSADYAFGQFRFLTKLLIVHGRWSYQRVADMHSNFFYKNVIWTFAMFWFLPWNSFEATYLYQYTFILLCNLVFTSLPVIVMGAFDQDINAKAAMAFPQLYVRGIRGLEYTRTKFWLYMLDGLYQSVVVYFIPFCVWYFGSAVSWNGKGIDSLADFGTTVAVAAIFAANTYVGLNTNYWTVITWITVVGSSLVMLAWIIVYSFFPSSDFNDEVVVLFGNITFWATVIVSVVVALGPRYLVKFVTTVYHPLDKDIVREMWVQGDLKDQLGIRRHRDRKRGDLESAPMFQKPHSRSESELSSIHHGYEPALTRSPGDTQVALAQPLGYHNAPSQSAIYGGVAIVPDYDQRVEDGEEQDVVLTPRQYSEGHIHTPTAAEAWRHSYYSASDIPPPSPLPSPKMGYLSGASNSFSTSPPSTSRTPTSAAFTSEKIHTPPGLYNETLQVPRGGSSREPESFELRVRSPPQDAGSRSTPTDRRDPSDASFATADEYGSDTEPDQDGDPGGRPSDYYAGPRVL